MNGIQGSRVGRGEKQIGLPDCAEGRSAAGRDASPLVRPRSGGIAIVPPRWLTWS